ncbi:MAG: hypothetical protein AAF764_00805 [Pseudomonadota bacterium]
MTGPVSHHDDEAPYVPSREIDYLAGHPIASPYLLNSRLVQSVSQSPEREALLYRWRKAYRAWERVEAKNRNRPETTKPKTLAALRDDVLHQAETDAANKLASLRSAFELRYAVTEQERAFAETPTAHPAPPNPFPPDTRASATNDPDRLLAGLTFADDLKRRTAQ